MPRWRYWLIAMLVLAVIIAAGYFPVLKRHLRQSAQVTPKSEEQVRRELTQPAAANAGEPMGKAKLFWSSGAGDGSLMPVTVDLPLSMDPVLRAKQVLNTLLAGPVDAELRTLPPDAVLLAFYLVAGRHGRGGFFRGVGDGDAVRNRERADGGRFDHEDAGSECAAGALAENSDSRAGSGYAGRASGFDADISGECQGDDGTRATCGSAGIGGAYACDGRIPPSAARWFRGEDSCDAKAGAAAKVDTHGSQRQTGARNQAASHEILTQRTRS